MTSTLCPALTFGSLFSGIGGFDLGFARAGMTCLWQSEIDSAARSVLRKQFPDANLYSDVTKLVRPPAVDVLCGGFPCQDLSVAGRRAGLAGARSGLWHEFRRLAGELAPRWVVIENVPGLLSSNGGRDFGVVLSGLEELGYRWAYRILDSQYDRVAQRRRRVFVVGSLGNGSCTEILFESESLRWDSAPRREAKQDIAGTLTQSLGRSRGSGVDPNTCVAGTLKSNSGGGGFGSDPSETFIVAPCLRAPSNCSHRADAEAFVVGTMRSNGDAYSGFELADGLTLARCVTSGEGQRNDFETCTMVVAPVADCLTGSWHNSNGATAGNNQGMINPIIHRSGVRRLTP